MITEGKGFTKPKPILKYLNREELTIARLLAEQIATKRGYDTNNMVIGYLGESAVAKHLFEKLDIKYLANFTIIEDSSGDGGIDITVLSQKIQVKTHRPGGRCLVRRIIDKKIIPLPPVDYFVFCEAKYESTVNILGYVSIKNLVQYGRLSNAKFLEIEEKFLDPIDRLVIYLQSIKNRS